MINLKILQIYGKEKQMNKCRNCAKYPFCNNCETPTGECDNWIKKESELQLKCKKDLKFQFEKIDNDFKI